MQLTRTFKAPFWPPLLSPRTAMRCRVWILHPLASTDDLARVQSAVAFSNGTRFMDMRKTSRYRRVAVVQAGTEDDQEDSQAFGYLPRYSNYVNR